jgi:cell surface protein SprA
LSVPDFIKRCAKIALFAQLCSLGLAGMPEVEAQSMSQDSVAIDTVYHPSEQPSFNPEFRFGDPLSTRTSKSAFILEDPSELQYDLTYDSTFRYSIYEQIGESYFRPATTMSFDEYDRIHSQQIINDYWRDQSIGLEGESAVGGRRLIPKLYVSPVLDRIFGGSYVDIQPTGFVNLDFGGLFQFLDNPSIPERQRRNGGFNFNMQISSNVVGKIGDKLAVTFNFDNNNSFDFQNDMKVDYTGYEEEIIKKIEIGNVSMPVSNSLIAGAQSLFGVKTQLQFGRLYVTGIASRQRGRNEVLNIENGVDEQQFELRASDYDENRHFFLGHFFRENYGIKRGQWLSNLPQVTSGVNITRLEVYVVNRNNETSETRNFLALADLGESSRLNNAGITSSPGYVTTDNDANDLYDRIDADAALREPDNVNQILESQYGMVEGTDFVKVTTARKLDLSEYSFNRELGFISLMRRLQNDEVLAVSYEYTYNGQVYKVGELTEDYQSLSDDKLIYLKMLRPNKIETRSPTWDLMMKNIYNLNAGQIQREGFTLRIHYRDDRTGQDNPSLHEGRLTKDIPLVELVGLDQLNPNNDRQRDGNFDFIEGITVDARTGTIIFPVVEPFGETLKSRFDPTETSLIDKYVFDTLYRTTQADAELIASKNKFFILGKFSGGSSSEIVLPGINVAPNSVVVMAGNTPLTEGLQYTVDYNLGRVRIIDDGILSSGKNITISYEKADLFNFQTRWLTGTQFDYIFSDQLSMGATLLHVNERPGGISRYSIGDEPTKNTKYGFNVNYQAEAPFITKALDFLPLVSTKAPSNITFSAEFAQLKPGTSNIVQGEGTSYIDDFENAITPINIGGWNAWKLAAVPTSLAEDFDQSSTTGSALGLNYRRAKMAWYTVDNSVFYRAGNNRPENITESDLENHYVKPVLPQDIYQQRDRNLVVVPESVFDVAYYPSERGPYNYNPDLRPNGQLSNPEENWAGITRAITNEVDFDKTNVEYLEFWLMDPFIGYNDRNPNGQIIDGIFNDNNRTGGELIFNLGSVSEDVNNDGKHFFENGLPESGNTGEATESIPWGFVPSTEYLTNFFINSAQARENQDVGLDGLKDELESEYFRDFVSELSVDQNTLRMIQSDPSADNFSYYLGDDLDARDAKILERYKNYNGLDGNSPISTSGLTQAATVLPDNEDLNNDNTISTLEQYYEYRIPLKPGDLDVGRGNIVDKVVDRSGEATWYLFRIPIREDFKKIGDIDGFKTIRYVRMYMTKWQQPVVLRMAKMQLVGSQWRKYEEPLNETGFNEVPETSTSDFFVSVVNIEENSVGDEETSPYVVPPGLDRDRDNTTFLNRRNNEQSLQICIEGLEDKDAKAVYKNVSFDLINYGRLKMFFHAEAYRGDMVLDDEVTAFLRFGTDFTENYYEIEVPLKVTPRNLTATGDDLARQVWPAENELDISINELLGLKSERNRNNLSSLVPYTSSSNNGKYTLTVKGRPDISTVLTMMIGVRNPQSQDRESKSVCVWANELRVTDFDTNKGWAANARIAAKLADIGNISASTRYTTIGFGTIQQRISERAREETFQYDISANVNLDKFLLPQKTGLKLPMFASYEETIQTPQFDPLDPDIPLDASLESFDNEEKRQQYRQLVQDRTIRKSLNFTNVRKEKVKKDKKAQIYDLSNFSMSYAFSDQQMSNVNTQVMQRKTQQGGLAYNYSLQSISIQPFANAKWLESPYLKLIKDINFSPLPSALSARADLNRSFIKTVLYSDLSAAFDGSSDLSSNTIAPYYERLFTFNRTYNLRWNFFKSLSFDYSARANAVIDEPDTQIEGDISTRAEREYIWGRVKDLGRMKNFTQDLSANYKLPLDKIPLTDWVSADLRYSVGYSWLAGSQNQTFNDSTEVIDFGNVIQNNRDQSATGKVDLVKLYNKVEFLKKINTPTRKKSKDETPFAKKIGKGFVRTLMSVRSVNATYSIRESTGLPGFNGTPFLFGMDSNFVAPGYDFLLGSQDPDIRFRAAENGWLTEWDQQTNPFQQTRSNDLNMRASVEPSRDLKIQLEANRSYNADYREIFRNTLFLDTLMNGAIDSTYSFASQTPARSGAYNISFLTIKTSFGDARNNNISTAFETFKENIGIIQQRKNSELGPSIYRYDSISQDVLVPAFLAAYSGQSANEVSLRPFPVIPIPNWRLDFAGLSNLPGLSDWFSSINITHGYRSNYAIGNYTNSLIYDDGLSLDNQILDYPTGNIANEDSVFVPVLIMNQVTIIEQFTPLLGINIRTNNNINARIDFKKDRNLSLNLSNAQVSETSNNDMVIDLGWTKDELKLPFKIQGRTITIENDVTFRFNMTIRDAKTIQRKLNGENVVSNGNRNFQLRPSMSYRLNDQLDITAYFDRNITDPRVASTFKRASTSFGFQLRFSLAQL